MRVLMYESLNVWKVQAAYDKVVKAISCDDFRAAQVKKMQTVGKTSFYRARLNDADRLLFCLVQHEGQVAALMLEIIYQHNYAQSRFLRGAVVDEQRIPDMELQEAITETVNEAAPMRYLHPERRLVHFLDKPISFDDRQDEVYRHKPPMIVVGSAGSGKTALTLEKMKRASGRVLYVTHSAYLTQNASELYYALGYENEEQEAVFLSYRNFVESIHVPEGREAHWRDFAAWFVRMRGQFKELEAHQVFEEFRGVITANADGVITRERYRELGVRQSIFPQEIRDRVYDCFERYLSWLNEAHLYDINIVAHAWCTHVRSEYDFVVVDEVQDLTVVQLSLILRTLKNPGHFLLCGDSNQIVHPNFFSWSQIKTLFWKDEQLVGQQQLKVLSANFRNGTETTRMANQLLKIKHLRFGSIDRESNFLVESVGGVAGQVRLLEDQDQVRRMLDQSARQSTEFAVLVMRDEDKALVRQSFTTPLLFSIHEAKGLEYENIVLFRFVSDHRAEFADITEGVDKSALDNIDLSYHRSRNKNDKSLEIYKFYINAFYVAITRAVRNLYIVESDVRHPMLDLMGLTQSIQIQVDTKKSSFEDWQKEAYKLEMQGKQEQADAIRERILKQTVPPWPVFDEPKIYDTLQKVFRSASPGNKLKRQLQEYAACHDEPVLEMVLLGEFKSVSAESFRQKHLALGRKSYTQYFVRNIKEVLRQCEQYGVEHRLLMNQTPLMAAAAAGNVPLVEALLERGASRTSVDQYGLNALHWAMREAMVDKTYAQGVFAELYELLAPANIDFMSHDRLIRIGRHLSEYLLVQTFWVYFKSCFTYIKRGNQYAMSARLIEECWSNFPVRVVSAARNQSQSISAVLARNEVDRDYTYNRFLFYRTSRGFYHFDPKLQVRLVHDNQEQWVPIFKALNLSLVHEFSHNGAEDVFGLLMKEAGLVLSEHMIKPAYLVILKEWMAKQQAIARGW